MKKLLITGATGFLGSRIAAYYKGRYEILTPTHREMDITDALSVESVIKAWKPDIVIHCAAVSDVGTCEKNPEDTWRINVKGSENIAQACKEVSAKCILCSSDQVYFGSTGKKPHEEDEHLMPANHYGRQKLHAEQSCLQINPDSVHLRLSWMYDKHSLLAGEHGDFVRTLLAHMEQNQEISYPVYDMRGITNVWEVVKNLEKAWELPGGVYHFGSPNDQSTYETAVKLFERLGLCDSILRPNEQAFCDAPRNLVMSQEKVNQYQITFSHTLDGLYEAMKEADQDIK